ncbi:Ldh family oxidoreductase [Vibrio chagasii]|nr:Ldh family oxidoreductase [Vibrio chagasii]
MVGMRNSNHWMRGGAYVLKMAREGFAGIASTNSIAVMPAWGGKDHRVGSNPLIRMAITGDPPVVVDCSVTQFSCGQLQNFVPDKNFLLWVASTTKATLTRPTYFGKTNVYCQWVSGKALQWRNRAEHDANRYHWW